MLKKDISKRWLIVALALGLIGAVWVGRRQFYPPPADVFESMWTARAEAWDAILAGSSETAIAKVEQWQGLVNKLPRAAWIHDEVLDAPIREQADVLATQLAQLHAALENGNTSDAADAMKKCFDAHDEAVRIFNTAYFKPTLVAAGHGGHDMVGGHVMPGHAGHAMEGGHKHGTIEIPDGDPIPTIQAQVHRDPKSGWNLQITTTDFRFAPEHVSQDHVPGEGHCHLYIDGAKVTRLYGEWYHLGKFAPGEHEVRVTLSANTHDEYTSSGEVIAAVARFRVDQGANQKDHTAGAMKAEKAMKPGHGGHSTGKQE